MINKEMSLQDLVLYKKNLEQSLPEGECLPDEVVEMHEIASALLETNIDKACKLVDGLSSYVHALELRLEHTKHLKEMALNLMKQAVVQSGQPRLDGIAYSLRVQTNGGVPSTIIDDESKIPMSFKRVTFTNSFSFNEDAMLYWVRALLGRFVQYKEDKSVNFENEKMVSPFYLLDISKAEREVLEKTFKVEPNKSVISEAIKNNEVVPGVHQERGTHLRILPGKTKEITNV